MGRAYLIFGTISSDIEGQTFGIYFAFIKISRNHNWIPSLLHKSKEKRNQELCLKRK